MNPSARSSPLVALVLLLPFFSPGRLDAQQEFFAKHPWPDHRKAVLPSHSPARGLFSATTHLDTAAFTLYDAGLLGVIVGNAQWIDYDNDADLDIFVSGTDGSIAKSIMYRNDAGAFSEVDVGIPPIITERGVAWGDFDNDSDFDLAITGILDSSGDQPVSKIFRNDGGSFTDIDAGLQDILGGVATWIDYNMDGRLDLLIAGSPDRGSTFVTRLYRNDDSGFVDSGIPFPGVWGASVDWGDYDNDGDPDLLLTGYGTLGMTSALFRNDGETFAYVPLPFEPVVFSAVSWGDFDGDGWLDFVVSGNPPGWTGLNTFTAIYHANTDGTFTLVPTDLPQLNGCGAAWGDYDNDGDLDLAINGWHDDSTNVTRIYRNDGGGNFTDIQAGLPGTWWGSVAWGDADDDGRLDLLISGGTGPQPFLAFYYGYVPWNPFYPVTQIYHNNGPNLNNAPTAPTELAVTMDAGRFVFSWAPSEDDRTPAEMLTYNLRIGSASGDIDIVAPASNLETGFRRVPRGGNSGLRLSRTLDLPPGTYFWSVQAVDQGYRGSAFPDVRPSEIERWRLVSVPYDAADWQTATLFPGARSPAYAFVPNGYLESGVLASGRGYWLKFRKQDDPMPLSNGPGIASAVIPVSAGWNLIGSIASAVDAVEVTSNPPGMITSIFYGYDEGYREAHVLEAGQGYWIKTTQDGTLTLSSAGAPGASDATARIRMTLLGETPPPPPGGAPASGGTPPLPSGFTLDQNYPNPFNPVTRLDYSVPQEGPVRIVVYNTLGEIVATPFSGHRAAGSYSAEFDARSLPGGVYFARMTAGSFIGVRKMVLVR